jgi:DNA-binding transcriptional LysR family regulator
MPWRDVDLEFADMLDFPDIGLAAASSTMQTIAEEAQRLGKAIDLHMNVNNFVAVRRMVQAGLGLAVLSEAVVAYYRDAMRIVGVPLRDASVRPELKICVRDLHSLPAPVHLFIKTVSGI